jgi:tRNA threonylcarbamoyladenosine biosynthesis protein TsaE
MLELRARSVADTHRIAAALAAVARAGDLIVLSGEMGSGKTAFAQGFGAALGVTEPITSPTFTLVHTYDLPPGAHGATALHHADLYRLERTTEVVDLALEELADDDGIVLVEWGDVVEALFGDHISVHLDHDPDGSDDETAVDIDELVGDTRRLVEISATGMAWASRWSRILAACGEFAC